MSTASVDGDLLPVQGVSTLLRREGSGRPVLYLHGAFFPTAWTGLHDELSARFDLLAPVHPGYVEGGPPDWLLGFDDLVLHYRALLDELDVGQVDLVGYGLGAWIAANVASFHPDRVRSLVAIAPMGLWMPDAPMLDFLGCSPERRIAAVFNGDPGGHETLFPDPGDIDSFIDGYGQDGVTARLIWERRYDTRLARRLGQLTAPALVLAPSEDRVVPLAHAARWAELLPDGRLVTIADTGHGLVVQAPDRVARAIGDFLEEVPA